MSMGAICGLQSIQRPSRNLLSLSRETSSSPTSHRRQQSDNRRLKDLERHHIFFLFCLYKITLQYVRGCSVSLYKLPQVALPCLFFPAPHSSSTVLQPKMMDSLKRYSFDQPPQLQMTDSSSASAPPIPLQVNAASEISPIMIVGDEYSYNGMRWYVWDRTALAQGSPLAQDLPHPSTSLVDPHGSIRAARANVAATRPNCGIDTTRLHHMRLVVAASDSKAISEAASNPTGGDVQALAPANPSSHSRTPAGTTTASSALSSRDLQLQIERYAAQLQAVAKPEDQKAVIEDIARYEPPTPQAVRQYYRSIAARIIDSESARGNVGQREGERWDAVWE